MRNKYANIMKFILNLDSGFKPFEGQEIEFKQLTFSGGEPHIKILSQIEIGTEVAVTHRICSFNDLGLLCIAVDAIKRLGLIPQTLFVPYFPAARQDRIMVAGEALSVKVYAEIINQFGFRNVMVFDPHSEVTPAVLNNCEVVNNHSFVSEIVKLIGENVFLVSPDGGALKKIYKVSEALGGLQVVECSKSRDVKTGKLSGFKVYEDDLQGKDCLVVDDICDGGGTFIGLAEELKNKNAGKLYLAVSHGIFSRGFENLKCFEQIFTTDSFKNIENEGVVQIKLADGLLS